VNLTVRREGGVLVVTAPGGGPSSLAQPFGEELAALAARDSLHLVLDLARVTQIDSRGLASIVYAYRNLPSGKRLLLCQAPDNVSRVFSMTRLDSILPIHPTASQAIDALTRPG
jgi:anti-sigma B factor antagonist